MPNIDQKLETWKNKLLDLGKRNRLLNYRDSKRSNFRIQKPSIIDLWDSFVVNENPIEFPYYDEDQVSLLSDEQENSLERNVMTNQAIKDQQKTLRNLREKAKTAMEEQGVNTLYLCFGFLKWSEDLNSEQYLLSPIILVPVTLTLESITSPYVLSLHEDEITFNPTDKKTIKGLYKQIVKKVSDDEIIEVLTSLLVCLLTFDCPDIFRVSQNNMDMVFEDIEDGNPILTSRFHANMTAIVFKKPFTKSIQVFVQGREAFS